MAISWRPTTVEPAENMEQKLAAAQAEYAQLAGAHNAAIAHIAELDAENLKLLGSPEMAELEAECAKWQAKAIKAWAEAGTALALARDAQVHVEFWQTEARRWEKQAAELGRQLADVREALADIEAWRANLIEHDIEPAPNVVDVFILPALRAAMKHL